MGQCSPSGATLSSLPTLLLKWSRVVPTPPPLWFPIIYPCPVAPAFRAPAAPQGSRAPGLSKFSSFPDESCCFICWELAFAFLFFFFFDLKRPAQLSAHRESTFSFHMSERFCFWGNLSELCFFCYLKYLVLLLSLFVDVFVFLKSVELREDRGHLFNSCFCPTFPSLCPSPQCPRKTGG